MFLRNVCFLACPKPQTSNLHQRLICLSTLACVYSASIRGPSIHYTSHIYLLHDNRKPVHLINVVNYVNILHLIPILYNFKKEWGCLLCVPVSTYNQGSQKRVTWEWITMTLSQCRWHNEFQVGLDKSVGPCLKTIAIKIHCNKIKFIVSLLSFRGENTLNACIVFFFFKVLLFGPKLN